MNFLSLTGHPDSFTTKNGPVLVAVDAIESITSWEGGARIATNGGPVYVAENVASIADLMNDV